MLYDMEIRHSMCESARAMSTETNDGDDTSFPFDALAAQNSTTPSPLLLLLSLLTTHLKLAQYVFTLESASSSTLG